MYNILQHLPLITGVLYALVQNGKVSEIGKWEISRCLPFLSDISHV